MAGRIIKHQRILAHLRTHPLIRLTEDNIRNRAYYGWEKGEDGYTEDSLKNWLKAEKQIAEKIVCQLLASKVTYAGHAPSDKFWEVYTQIAGHTFTADSERLYVGNRDDKICSLCGRANEETSFRKRAHIIPEQFGNRWLFSNEECDECNSRYGSTFETEIGNMLIADRAFSGLRKKGTRTAKLKYRKDGGSIGGQVLGAPLEIIDVFGDDSLTVDVKGNTVKVEVSVPPYNPLHAAKALAKSMWLLLSPTQRQKYEFILRWIDDQADTSIGGVLCRTFIPGPVSLPLGIYVWERLPEKTEYPPLVCMMLFGNTTLQVAIPETGDCKDYLFCEMPALPEGFSLSTDIQLLAKDGKVYPGKTSFNIVFGEASALELNKEVDVGIYDLTSEQPICDAVVISVFSSDVQQTVEMRGSDSPFLLRFETDRSNGKREMYYEIDLTEDTDSVTMAVKELESIFRSTGLLAKDRETKEDLLRVAITSNMAEVRKLEELKDILLGNRLLNSILEKGISVSDYLADKQCKEFAKLAEGYELVRGFSEPQEIAIPMSKFCEAQFDTLRKAITAEQMQISSIADIPVQLNGKKNALKNIQQTFYCLNIPNREDILIAENYQQLPEVLRAKYDRLVYRTS